METLPLCGEEVGQKQIPWDCGVIYWSFQTTYIIFHFSWFHWRAGTWEDKYDSNFSNAIAEALIQIEGEKEERKKDVGHEKSEPHIKFQ